jgi:hypothetical protein
MELNIKIQYLLMYKYTSRLFVSFEIHSTDTFSMKSMLSKFKSVNLQVGYTKHERALCNRIGLNKKIGFRPIRVQNERACLVYPNGFTGRRLEKSRKSKLFTIFGIQPSIL